MGIYIHYIHIYYVIDIIKFNNIVNIKMQPRARLDR